MALYDEEIYVKRTEHKGNLQLDSVWKQWCTVLHYWIQQLRKTTENTFRSEIGIMKKAQTYCFWQNGNSVAA